MFPYRYLLHKLWPLAAAALLLLTPACAPQAATPDSARVLLTVQAATIQAMSAQLTVQAAQPTATLAQSTLSQQPAASQTPSMPPGTPTPAPLVGGCQRAEFVSDLTIPDGMLIPPGSSFTKTWAIRNTGSCAWTTGYVLVWVGGDDLGAAHETALTKEVQPGETGQLSVSFTAPDDTQLHRSFWKLRSPDGVLFGVVSPEGDRAFYVEMRSGREYSFADNLCAATWKSNSGDLPCPGTASATAAYTYAKVGLKTENGTVENDLALVTAPEPVKGGYIIGQYPPVMIPKGSHLYTVLGCAYGAEQCSVHFRITYTVDGGPEQVLFDGSKSYADAPLKVDQRMDQLALVGKSVGFIFQVISDGTPGQDIAYWLAPRLGP